MVFHTVKENERILVFNRSGAARCVAGPRRIYVGPREKMEHMPRHVASQDQYLVVQYRDGHKEHITGPTEMFMNRLELDYIFMKNSIKIDDNQMIIIYKQLEGIIERRIVPGPTIFIPGPHEWIHEFTWHGSNRDAPGHYIPGKNKFTLLRHIPSHLYVSVRDVRTSDISVINVKLMLFFYLDDVERMLTYTHDPIADFINAVSADIIAFASQRTYEEFIRNTDDLNSMDCYTHLVSRAQHVGYKISKVVYRGFAAAPPLQATHDNAVRTRMSLRLDAESEEQEQTIQKFQLTRENERTKLKHDMDTKLLYHQQELEKMRQMAAIEEEKLHLEAKLNKELKEVSMEAEVDRSENEQKAKFLKELKKLGVDATRYLVSLQPQFQVENEVVAVP